MEGKKPLEAEALLEKIFYYMNQLVNEKDFKKTLLLLMLFYMTSSSFLYNAEYPIFSVFIVLVVTLVNFLQLFIKFFFFFFVQRLIIFWRKMSFKKLRFHSSGNGGGLTQWLFQ